ncbi:MAG TPA: hypothetical protein VN641_07165, partial [Urbifossiella sp.]|nr:hypothetical protein [Urbifossiella sp.]
EKVGDGISKAAVPFLNELFLRFTNGYLYIGRTAKDLDAKKLLAPMAFFAADDGAVISIAARLDRIPAEVKTLFFGQFEHKVMEEQKKNQAGQDEIKKKVAALTTDAGIGAVKMLLDDGKELSLKAFADPKSDDLRIELTVTAKDGTALSKTFSGLSGRTSLPAAIAAVKNPVAHLSSKAGLPEALKKRFEPVIDQMVKDAIDKAGDREAARRVLEPLAATAKAGNVDFAITLAGPDANKHYSVVAAAMITDARELEKVAKAYAPMVPANVAEITFDVEKIGKFSLHKLVAKEDDADFDKVFGTRTGWMAVSDDCIAVSIEPEGALLKAGLKASPAAAPVLDGEVALARLVPLVEKKLKPDEMQALIKDSFGNSPPAGKDTIGLSIQGGRQLSVKFKMKGKAFRLATMLDQFKLR